MVSLILALAQAADVPVAVRDLSPGTPVRAEDLRWVELASSHPLAVDALDDPVGHIVIEQVLEGEVVRAERLLDVDKPERVAVPGMRALRVPGPLGPTTERRADVWTVHGDAPCTLVQGTWILGVGKDMQGVPDSTFVLVTPQQALEVQLVAMDQPLQVRPVSQATAARERPELACSR